MNVPFNAVTAELGKTITAVSVQSTSDYAFCGVSMYPVHIEIGTVSVEQPNGGFELQLEFPGQTEYASTSNVRTSGTNMCPPFIQVTSSGIQTQTPSFTHYNVIKFLQNGVYRVSTENFPTLDSLKSMFTQTNTTNPAIGETVINNMVTYTHGALAPTYSGDITATAGDTIRPKHFNIVHQKRVPLNNTTKKTPSTWTNQTVTFDCAGVATFPTAKIIIEKIT